MTYEPLPSVARATVVAGGVTTEYLCAGTGRPLLVLAREGLRAGLIEAVPAGYRVLAPLVSETGQTFDVERLIELLDGLGIWDVQVVAGEEFAPLARASAESFPERFTEVLIVDFGTIDLTGALASLAR